VDFENNFISDFNGEVSIVVFDKPVQRQTLGQLNSTAIGTVSSQNPEGRNNPVIPFEVQENAVFRGRVPVINGEFRADFMAAKDINYNFGLGKISYYASSDSVDATGFFDSIIIGGFGEHFGDSADPPIVRLFLTGSLLSEDTNFLSGNITTPDPVLLAHVFDQYDINHSGAGFGHNISLVINDDFRRQIWLNNFFERLPNKPGEDGVRGEIRYPMFDLPPGKYNLRLRVSNVFNVSTEETISFEVIQSNELIIAKLYCFPNPIRDHTTFYFTHNAPQKIRRVEVDIFDVSGGLVTRLIPNGRDIIPNAEDGSPDGFAIKIPWDLNTGRGNQLRQGLYFYRLRIVCEDGRVAERIERLVVTG
jgi:hypothetical protein